ncbi:MAG: hypothetical protein LBB46_02325, partial [Coriobacteriaceae bacterium]|nr:hypothetical protein [Coriobacteriaceae bacterium]
MDTHADTPSPILESRKDTLLRLVAAYCSLDSGERAALWEAYDAGGGELCPAPADPAQGGLAQG